MSTFAPVSLESSLSEATVVEHSHPFVPCTVRFACALSDDEMAIVREWLQQRYPMVMLGEPGTT